MEMHDAVELLARKDTDTMTDESMAPHGSHDVAQSEHNQSEKTLQSEQVNITHRSDGDKDREVHDAESAPGQQASAAAESPAPAKEHPRKDLVDWKWKCTILVIFMTSFINGEFLLLLLNAPVRPVSVSVSVSSCPSRGGTFLGILYAAPSLILKLHRFHARSE